MSFLTDRDIEQIHASSMRVLEEVGVVFPTQEALEVFRKHRVRTEGHKVFLTEAQLWSAIGSAPQSFTILARNPEKSVVIGGGDMVFAPGYGCPFLIDAEAGKRPATFEDYIKSVKLAQMLPNQDMSGFLMVEPADLPARTAHLHMLMAHMLHSDKPFIGSTNGARGAAYTMEMSDILFGPGMDISYVTVGLINSLSPLAYSAEMLEALMVYACRGQPLVFAALSMAGSTGPVTLAGVLVHQTAELLAGIALVQLINPGTPVLFGSTSTNLDMKTGGLAVGGPELSMMIAAHADLCRFYKLPCRSGGALTDAHGADAQAGYESMMSLLTTANSGVDFVLHAGGISSSYLAFSFEKFVLDDEICGMVRRFRRGIVVDPETLAFDVIARVGSGGNYLMENHTLERYRSEFWLPKVFSRTGIEKWQQEGRPDVKQRALSRWKKLVADHQDPPLEGSVTRQLQKYVESRTA